MVTPELEAIKHHVDTANAVNYIRAAFVGLGVEATNIKSVHYSPGGFAANPCRWCVVLHRAVSLSAERVNSVPGISGAVWNGNICHVIVGKVSEGMSEIAWGYLSMRQQETLRDIVLGNGAVVFDPQMKGLCNWLNGHGLVEIVSQNEVDGAIMVDPTDKGREVYAQHPAPATFANADSLPVLPGSPLDERLASAQQPAMNFKPGQEVIVTGVTPNESFEGCKGTIVRAGEFHDWLVDVTFPDGNHDELGYDTDELTLVSAQQPAAVDGVVADVDETPLSDRLENYRAIFHDVIAGHLTTTPMVMAERGLYLLKHIASLEALATANADLLANAQHELDTLRTELAETRQRLAAAEGTRDEALASAQALAEESRNILWDANLYTDALNEITRISLEDISQHEMKTRIRFHIREVYSPSVPRQRELDKLRQAWEAAEFPAAQASEGGAK